MRALPGTPDVADGRPADVRAVETAARVSLYKLLRLRPLLVAAGRNTRRVFRRLEKLAATMAVGGMALLIATLSLPARAELSALSETELAAIDGQQGVLLNLNLRNNVAANYAPIGCTAVVGTPNPCRMGLEFAARSGTWLMLKEYFGTFQLKDLRVDIAFLPAAASGYHDPARFDANGNAACSSPLLPSCRPNGRPALQLTFPGADAPGVYDDFLSFLNIGRVWLEFDNGGTPGMQRDTSTNSMFGVRMSDSRALNEPAHMRFLGKGFVYGF